MWRKTAAVGAAAALTFVGFTATAPLTARAATPGPCGDTEAGMALGDGAEAYTTITTAQTNAKSDSLAGVIKWRQDALNDTSVKWQGMTMRDYLASKGISEASYLNPQWSYDMERIAMQRAVEAYEFADGHTRTNGTLWQTLTSEGEESDGEILAWGDSSFAGAIDHWAGEKSAYVNQTGEVTGHYTTLIDPTNLAYGFGRSNSADYGTDFAGEASKVASTNTSATNWSGQCEFRVPLSQDKLSAGVTITPTSAVVGETKALTVDATVDGGRYTLRGTLASSDSGVATVSGQDITAVKAGTTQLSLSTGTLTSPATTFAVTARVADSVTNPAGVTTPSGTYPTLPSTVQVNWNDGSSTQETVTWDAMPASQYAARAGGVFTLNGTAAGKPVTIQVTVTPATITSVADVAATTPAGTAPTLPGTVRATWSNGDTSNEAVTWDTIPASSYAAADNVFDVPGTVNGYSGKAKATVTVTAALATSADPASATTIATHAPSLPGTVAVHWSDGTTTQEPVTWPADPASNYATPGSYTLTAPIAGTGARTADGKPLTASVTVTVQARAITSVAAPDPITVESGTKPTLPSTVVATYNDGQTATVPVTWAEVTKDQYGAITGGQFDIPGTVAGFAAGTVQRLVVNMATITSVDYTTQTVTTVEGVFPSTPSTTDVHWSNGDTTHQEITWDAIPADKYTAPGTFSVTGSTPNWSQPLTLNVVVTAKQKVRVEPFADVTTTVGTAPQLPADATTTWNNGTTSTSPITWNPIPADAYAAPGTFVVTGVTAAGDPVTVTVIVTTVPVPAPSASPTPQAPGEPQTPATSDDAGLADTGAPMGPWLPLGAVVLVGTGAVLSRRRH